MNLNKKYKDLLIKIISKHINNCTIYLFGSRATSSNSGSSDIDIAIDSGKKIDIVILGNIKDEIEESIIPFFVDIVDLKNVSEEMESQILKTGKVWND